jgi:hypothetical protein
MEELSATVLAVLWRSEDGSRVVARARAPSGDFVTASGPDRADCPLGELLSFRFQGRWDDHPKFGRQFKFDAAILSAPVDRLGMVAYLTTLADNIGAKRAARLWELYGDQAAEVLRTQPLRAVAAGVLGENEARAASKCLELSAGRERVLLELLSLLAGRGFGRKLPTEAIALWGERATQVVRKNPYLLMLRDLPGAGWKRCDKLWLDCGRGAAHPKRQVMAAIAYLREGHGDTWHDARRVAGAISDACGAEDARAEERLAEKVKELSAWTKRARRYEATGSRSA